MAEPLDAPAAMSAPPTARPIELPRADPLRQARRRRETAVAVARRLTPLLARRATGHDVADRHLARAFRLVADDLGASYTKFGQFVASAPGIFGDDVATELAGCLDDGPRVPIERVRRAVERDLGRPVDAVFASFDPEPLGCASIAVVHRATLRDGREVAVKVLRPGITHTVATDLVLMRQLFTVIGRAARSELGAGLQQGLDNFKAQVREELDLRNEAAAMAHYRRLFTDAGLHRVMVPEPHPELSGRRVLVMELLDGVAVHDADELVARVDDPAPLIADVVRAWFVTAIRSGTFHGDIHAGNLMALHDGRVAMIDWGIVGRLDPPSHHLFRRILQGALGDERALDDVADFFTAQAAPVLQLMGLDDEAARAFVKVRTREIFTKPFGEIGFGQLLVQGGPTGDAGLRDVLRDARDLPPPPPLDRGLFLLGKQLMFLESYGRRYLADQPLLDDADFFRALLADTSPAPDPLG